MSKADPDNSRRNLLVVGSVLSLVLVVVGSVRFARFDWTGLPLDRGPTFAERQVGPNCLEQIKPYVTESGRTIEPVVVDEMQYLALVEHFRGVPNSELQVTCLYDPFTNRSGMSWIAHWIPGDEGVALSLANSFMLLAGLWIVLATLSAKGARPREILAAGTLYTVAWNPFYFGTGILIDAGVIAAIALCWYLISTRRHWWVWPVMLVGYPLKETIGIVVPVMWAAAWKEYRDGGSTAARAVAPALTATIAFVVGVGVWRRVLPAADASWEVTPDLGDISKNLGDIIGLTSFAIGVLPLLIPAYLVYRRVQRIDGWRVAIVDPATVGVIVALGICGWSLITVDLTPRIFWIGFPFAASLAARWFSEGKPRAWLDALPIPLPRADSSAAK